MATLGDYEIALRMNALVESIARRVIDQERPSYRYGIVTNIDVPNRRCTVQFTGDDTEVSVAILSARPSRTGQIVRVEGRRGDFFIDDIVDSKVSAFVETLTFDPYLSDPNIPKPVFEFWTLNDTLGLRTDTLDPDDPERFQEVLTYGSDAKNFIYYVPLYGLSGVGRGTGELQGTNYVNVTNPSAQTHSSNGSWVSITWNNLQFSVQDDGTIISPPGYLFASQKKGIYIAHAKVTFATSSTAGFRGMRWITQGGTVLDQRVQAAADIGGNLPTSAWIGYLGGGGYAIQAQAYQNSGGSLSMQAHAVSTPFEATFCQVA